MIYCLFPNIYDLRIYDDTTLIQQFSGAGVRMLDTGWLTQPLDNTFYELSTIGILGDFAWSEANMFGLFFVKAFLVWMSR